MKKCVVTIFCGLTAVALAVSSASALPEFNAAFKAMYVKPDGTDEEKAFAKAVNEKKCNVCHGKNPDTGKDDKKIKNRYGKALDELLSKDDKKDKDKINKALEEVAEKKIDDEDEESPTFGDLIKEGKLPGEEEVKEEDK